MFFVLINKGKSSRCCGIRSKCLFTPHFCPNQGSVFYETCCFDGGCGLICTKKRTRFSALSQNWEGGAQCFVLLLRWRFVMKLTQSVTFMTSLCQSMYWKLSISIFWEIFSWLVAILPDRTRRISPSRRKSEKNSISFTSKTA